MARKPQPPARPPKQPLSAQMALPLDAQLRLAESRRQLALARYKIGVRRGSAWLDHTAKQKQRTDI